MGLSPLGFLQAGAFSTEDVGRIVGAELAEDAGEATKLVGEATMASGLWPIIMDVNLRNFHKSTEAFHDRRAELAPDMMRKSSGVGSPRVCNMINYNANTQFNSNGCVRAIDLQAAPNSEPPRDDLEDLKESRRYRF